MLKRFLWPTLLVVLLWMVLSIPTTFYLLWLARSTNSIRKASEPSVRAAHRMQRVVWKIQSTAIQHSRQSVESPEGSLSDLEQEFQAKLKEAQIGTVYPEEPAIVAEIERHWQSFDEFARQLWLSQNQEPINTDKLAELDLLAQRVVVDCAQLAYVNNRYLDESFTRRRNLERRISIFRLGYLFFGPLIGILAGLKMARRLAQTISKINVTLTGAADSLDKQLGSVDVTVVGDPDDLQVANRQVELVASRIREIVAKLAQARKKVVESERLAAVGALAAGVAHEIRNPLTSIRLLMQTGRRSGEETVLEDESLEIILNEIERMEQTIRRLLEFAKPQQMNRTQLDLRNTIHGAVALVTGRARQRGVIINASIPDHAVIVGGDEQLLHQMLVNLLINAIDFSAANDSVDIQLLGPIGDDKSVRVTVADNGPGVPPADLERIFEPFVTNRADGIGLGLSLCKEIVQRHHGSISAGNREGGGTLFIVQLPNAESFSDSTSEISSTLITTQGRITAVSTA